jgi:hypothetical protein
MSLTTESNTKVLSSVDILEETASSRVNLIINDNGVIK